MAILSAHSATAHATDVALTSTQRGLWWGAIVGGLVVVIVVALLLAVLISYVRTIDRQVVTVRGTLQAAKDNTADTALIEKTGAAVDGVLAEGLNHHLFLGRVLAKVRM